MSNAGVLAMAGGPKFLLEAVACLSRASSAGAAEPYRLLAKAVLDAMLQDTAKGILDGGV